MHDEMFLEAQITSQHRASNSEIPLPVFAVMCQELDSLGSFLPFVTTTRMRSTCYHGNTARLGQRSDFSAPRVRPGRPFWQVNTDPTLEKCCHLIQSTDLMVI